MVQNKWGSGGGSNDLRSKLADAFWNAGRSQ